jgi:thiol-disulfide isomerase/thioredoxin
VKIPAGKDPSQFVVGEMARAQVDKKKLVIYVGASWCEPCRHFHEAAESHALDAAFGDVRFIDLDHDQDAAALSALSCDSKLIPLFALPGADGRCSDRRVEGGIKGDGAVAYLAPRLRTLLGP